MNGRGAPTKSPIAPLATGLPVSRRTAVRVGALLWCALPAGIRSVLAADLRSIRVRDPFVLADAATKAYYLYAQTENRRPARGAPLGVEVYTSSDLATWTEPRIAFAVPQDFWARRMVWAPEVHAYRGRYYLFVTLTAGDSLPGTSRQAGEPLYKRGTQIFVSDSPEGPFQPFANRPHTPPEWQALDGTLWVEDGQPWMVFCHEWTQIGDGSVEAVPLKDDLSGTDGRPLTLFHASEAGWVRSVTPKGAPPAFVTDGPFLHRTKNGNLLLIWSSFGAAGYALAIAESRTRKIRGPWRQQPGMLFREDGGHAMIFRDFDGRLMLALHQPNKSPDERARFFELEDNGTTLRLRD